MISKSLEINKYSTSQYSLFRCSRILPGRGINPLEAECFCCRPNYKSCMGFLDSGISNRRLYIIHSRLLSILESNDIG